MTQKIVLALTFVLLFLSCSPGKKTNGMEILKVRTGEYKLRRMRMILLRGIVEPEPGVKVLSRNSGEVFTLRAGGENVHAGETIGYLISGKRKQNLVAPVSGIVWNILPNGPVDKGKLLFSVHTSGFYRINLVIPPSLKRKLYPGMRAGIELPLLFNNTAIGTLGKGKNENFFVTFRFPPRTAEYLSARVSLRPGNYNLFEIPRDAITSPDGSRKFVYVLRNGRSVRNEIQPYSFIEGNRILAHANFIAGDQILTAPIGKLVHNQRVEVAK